MAECYLPTCKDLRRLARQVDFLAAVVREDVGPSLDRLDGHNLIISITTMLSQVDMPHQVIELRAVELLVEAIVRLK